MRLPSRTRRRRIPARFTHAAIIALVGGFAGAGGAAAGTAADAPAAGTPPTVSAGFLVEALWYLPLVGVQLSFAERSLALDLTATTLIAVSSLEVGVRLRTSANGPYVYTRGGLIAVAGVGGGPACNECATGPAAGKRLDVGLGMPLQRRSGRRWFVELGGMAVWNDEKEVSGALRTGVGYAFR